MIRKHKAGDGTTSYYVYVTVPGDDRKKYLGKAHTKDEARELERQGQSKEWQRHRRAHRRDLDSILFSDLALPWVEARKDVGHDGHPRRAAWRDDESRMRKHIVPFYGNRRLIDCGSVDLVRRFVKQMESVIGGTTAGHVLRLLSRFFNELPDDLRAEVGNPVSLLDKADRPRPSHDSRTTPFLEEKAHIRLLLDGLPTVVGGIYAVCALAGLRPGEARALYPTDIRLERRCINIERAAKDKGGPEMPRIGPVKDHEMRLAPINEDLLAILRDYLPRRINVMKTTSKFLFPALKERVGSCGMISLHTLEDTFNEVRDRLNLPKVTFYQASRHTYASHYVMGGGRIEQLSKILGHGSVQVTERYAHLSPSHFDEHDFRPMLDIKKGRRGLRAIPGGRAGKGESS